MSQDERMKDVFSELDGFIVLVSVLSTLRDGANSQEEWDGTMEAAFKTMIVALDLHPRNQALFEVCALIVANVGLPDPRSNQSQQSNSPL